MSIRIAGSRRVAVWLAVLGLMTALSSPAAAQTATGPYNAEIAAGGDAIAKAPGPGNVAGAKAWTLQAWIEPAQVPAGSIPIAGLGDAATGLSLTLKDGVPAVAANGAVVTGGAALTAGRWTHVAASNDGETLRLYVDGREVATSKAPASPGPAQAGLIIAQRAPGAPAFAGRIAGLSVTPSPTSADRIRQLAADRPRPELIAFEPNSPVWAVQVRQMYGQVSPQDPWTLPSSRTPPQAPVAKPAPTGPALAERGAGLWDIAGWRLAEGPKVAAGGAAISQAGFDAKGWHAATVPGTVLTTLVDRGVYPTPEYGLNNLVIPETLARQDYWYRTEFDTPAGAAGKRHVLTFKGVNYAGEMWLNGRRIGTTKGAFIRGRFDVTGLLSVTGRNALAVRVSPPPHPGLNHEESLTSGVGENGGMQMLDGPTFVASEGWDWIPTVRDRNTGLWQGVELAATGDVQLGDAHVVTTLPRPDNTSADVRIAIPVRNLSSAPVTAEVGAAFDDVRVSTSVTLAAGATTTVVLSPADFPQLSVRNPKLWWPNGYGAQDLHKLRLTVSAGGAACDSRDIRFGMRQITYEISLMDKAGNLRRVAIDLSKASAAGQRIVDGSHAGIRKVTNGYAASFAEGAETSPAVTPVAGDEGLSPYLIIRVNGVRIAARGGNIGMDDFMKRVGRERLEPYFRLHQDAHLNIVRNWVGQNTEEVFYDLADEYGMLILNDFWESTQNYNIEAQDVALFAANAEDVIRRFRNHPSIAVWFGRNEGVPQPLLNEALQDVVHREDGTRIYMGSSNTVNLQGSGPYNWRQPAEYFTEHAKGFSVELGTPSFPTLESWKRAIPASELWPISDTWAYHDWHQTGNGAIATYMDAMTAQLGKPTSLEDFERKAQLMQYVGYRAIFEGFNAGLWKTNSARLLWMTQPAWPSSAWQIFSSDYDTHGSFYGVKTASQPVHVQMNLPDFKVIAVNNLRTPLSGASVAATVQALDGRVLAEPKATVSAEPGQTTEAFTLPLGPLLAEHGLVLVSLELRDGSGAVLSRNDYWQGRDDAAYQALNTLPAAPLTLKAAARRDGAETITAVDVTNPARTSALAVKLTLFDAKGAQVLPAYFSDNYISLQPGETRRVEIRYPAATLKGPGSVAARGWNVKPATARVAAPSAGGR
jgi:glycosyl hydrolase family 2/Ig-like domain-containing protein/concanavalin A-like lectin/glucanase superfamily protein